MFISKTTLYLKNGCKYKAYVRNKQCGNVEIEVESRLDNNKVRYLTYIDQLGEWYESVIKSKDYDENFLSWEKTNLDIDYLEIIDKYITGRAEIKE